MRQWSTYKSRYSVEFAPAASAALAKLQPQTASRVVDEVEALAELADLAPIPHAAALLASATLPPLHLTVGELNVTYVIERAARRLRVVELAPL